MELAEKVMILEERTTFLGDLLAIRRGTREVENFVRKQEKLRHEPRENVSNSDWNKMVEREREAVMKIMENKLNDNILKGARRGRELYQLKGRLFWRMGRERDRRKFNNTLRERLGRMRKVVQKSHREQVRAIKMNYKEQDKFQLPKELQRYRKAKIFSKDAKETFKPGQVIGTVMVGVEENLLDKDEIAMLCRGPKFCIRRALDEERFLVECEKSYFKVRLEMNDLEETEDPGGGEEKESEEERLERLRIERAAEIAELETRTVFNEDEVRLDYGKKRATDCKHNTCVKLPGPKSAKLEEGIEYRRMTWKKIFWDFLNEMTDEEGLQESNLTKEEAAGLEKLKKKVKEGKIVIVRTDKSLRY